VGQHRRALSVVSHDLGAISAAVPGVYCSIADEGLSGFVLASTLSCS